MIHKNQTSQDLSIPMPITQDAQQFAQQFANEQSNQQKALQVYLNTLAVCSVNNYLRIMGIPTNLKAGDSWNPLLRLVTDVADLWVSDPLVRLECRPVTGTKLDLKTTQKPNNHLPFRFIGSEPIFQEKSALLSCHIPPEVQCERIGYVVVQIDLDQQEATLLGFSPIAADELLLSQLQSISDLLKHLESKKPAHLSLWLQDLFESGWQSVESLLNTQKANYAFRGRVVNSIRRAKTINLGTQLAESTMALAVTLTQQKAANFSISLQVLSVGGETHLPPGLKLAVLDESGATFLEASSESTDSLIQTRQFSGQSGERFSVQISLGEDMSLEDFVI